MRRQLTTTAEPSLSDVLLNELRVDTAISVFLEIAGGSAIDIGARRSPIVHVVLEGEIQVIPAGDFPPLTLSAGDSLLAFYGDAHRLGAQRVEPFPDPFAAPAGSSTEAPGVVHTGAKPRVALLFSSAISLHYLSPSAFAYRAAPDFWIGRAAGLDDCPLERSIVMDTAQIMRSCSGQGGSAFATAFASLHYVHLMRQMSLRLLKDRPLDVRAPNTRRMARVVREIRDRPDLKWTVARLAHRVGLSRSTFAETFVAYEQLAPLAFVTRVRMERAAQLLKTKALSLHEAARRVGYQNEASFARAFKRHWGVTPGGFVRGAGRKR